MSTKTILRTTASTLTYTGTTESPELFTNMTATMSTGTTLTHTTTLINTKTTASSDAKSKSTSPTMFHSSSELNNISNSVEASISTQSLTGTDSVYSTLKLSTAIKSFSDLGTFSTTENTNGNSTFDQSTTRIGQRNKHSITSYQPTDTTMYRESKDEGIWNPFTDVHTLTAASASTVIVVVLVIIILVIRKKKQGKCQSEDNARNGDYKLPTAGNNFKSYETPCDLDSSEYHIPSQVDNTYQTLDFTVRSHVSPKFAAENNYSISNIANLNLKEDHFTKGKNAMFDLKGIVDERDRNLQKTPLFHQSPSTKTIPSEETVAYCDTAIFHQEFLYDVPKNSIIDGVINPKNYFTGNQNAVATIPSKEINQLKSTRILKDKTVNAMDSFKEKLNMSLSKKQFRQPNAYPVNPFPPSDTEIYSFAK
ncbi:uncharacterized protein [Mytilus edulis]|uniref:uncharacterized protein n=1 Tax=Mytilus edulis TaxID=6550 RepID=UPI0039F0C429